jgi:YYY domain-containing protein
VTDAALFWLLVEVIGLLALPAGRALFGRLPGGGLAFSRPLGLLLAVYPAWLLASVHLVGYGRATVFVGLGLLAAVFLVWSVPRFPSLLRAGAARAALRTTPVRLWLAGELIFTIGFFGWALVRSYSPDVWQTEKPMDMAFVNSVNRTEWFPPHDPWLSGAPLNYYYYGHYLVASVVRATGIDSVSGFNLGLALFFALTLSTVFALASALYLAATRAGAPRRSPVAVGVVGAVLTVVLGNLAGGVQYLQHPDHVGQYDWWSPSRVIPGTANEFPVFSFLLGDLHAHVLAVPFMLLAIALALRLALSGPRLAFDLRSAVELVLAALAVGVLYPLNSLDFPVAVVLVLGGLALWATRRGTRGRIRVGAAAWFGIWVAAGVLLYLPFWIHFSPAVHGLGIVGEHQSFGAFARDELLVYGLFLWVIAAAYLHRAARVRLKYLAWGVVAAVFVLVLLAPRHYAGMTLLLALAAFATYIAFDPSRSQPYRFVWLLVAAGLGAIAVGEVMYLRDFFAGTSSYRFNTVFKFGYHAWFLLALAASCIVFWSRAWMGRRVRVLWLGGLTALVALSLAYPVLGGYSRSQGFASSPSLDGDGWLARNHPGDPAAIAWLRSLQGDPTVLETVGADFDFDGRGRISTYTGLPTVIQWPGHEVQWGHDPGPRTRDVQRIYRTTDLRIARSLLERYRVRYVVVGGLERRDYPPAALAKFDRLGRRSFQAGGTVVYETRTG